MRTIQVLLPVYLVGNFYQFEAVSSARDALDVLESFQPDLIISDVNMPDMSGPELCNAVRASPRFRDLPFVLITGSVTEDEFFELRRLSRADAVLRKPIDAEALAETVQRLLGERE